MVLLPRIVDAVAPAFVLAAGGIADARGLAAALCLGADGVVMGTRFLATFEANAHPIYKARLVAATEEDTVRTVLFGHGWPHAPHRTLRTRFVREWADRESETQDSRHTLGQAVVGGLGKDSGNWRGKLRISKICVFNENNPIGIGLYDAVCGGYKSRYSGATGSVSSPDRFA